MNEMAIFVCVFSYFTKKNVVCTRLNAIFLQFLSPCDFYVL